MKRKVYQRFLCCMMMGTLFLSGVPFSENTQPILVQAEESSVVDNANVNHVRTATLTASTEEAASLPAAYAGDGNTNTRWASDYTDLSAQWLKAEFTQVTKIKQIKLTLHTRDVAPTPSNISKFTIKYTDKNGEEKVLVNEYENQTVTGKDGYQTQINIVLDEAVEAKSIKICDFQASAEKYNNLGIVELEAYSNEVSADSITSVEAAVSYLEEAGGSTIGKEVNTFTLPVIEGYTVSLNGADFEQIIGDDLSIVHPLTDKSVQVSYVVTDASGNSAKTGDITYIVEGKYTQPEGKNSKPVIIPEIAEWYSESDEKLESSKLTKVVYDDETLEAIVDEFISDYKDFSGITLEKVQGASQAGAFVFSKNAPDKLLGEEGYYMDILEDRIFVQSGSITGNMYGMQTILQMYKQDASGYAKGSMRDYPRFETRGLLLDIARKPVGMDMIQDIARTMRYYKMNDFQLHLSDNYIWLEDYGKLETEENAFQAYDAFRLECGVTNAEGESPTAKDYVISKKDMREFIQGQRALGMNIVPEIDMPAHANSFTKIWPELMVQNKTSPTSSNRPLVDHLDVSKTETIEKIEDIFDDYTQGKNPTFDSETVIHIGADEFMTNATAYRQFVNTLVPYVKQTNTVRMWGGLTYINDGKTTITKDAIENVQLNLWSKDWADGLEMYEMGYQLINTIDDYGYMVPDGSLTRQNSYGDLLNVTRIFNSFEPNKVRTSSGYVSLPSGDKQILGAAYAIWNDNIDKRASGLSESDLYYRFFDALPFYAEKTWAATGQEKGTADTLSALAQQQGVGPNTNPYDQETSVESVYESYDFEDGLEDTSKNDRDLIAGTASIEDGVLVLDEDNSYVTTPISRLGNGNELSFDITLTEVPEAGDIIFESTAEYGTHDIRIMEDGTLGFTRELYNYYFDYKLPIGKQVNVKLVTEQQKTTLYVNDELVGTATGKFIHNDMVKKTGISNATFALPLERIGSKEQAIAAEIDNVIVQESAETEDTYNKSAWTGSTNSETNYNATEGLLKYAFDNNASTIWHSNWKGATDQLTGSNSFYAEIDFGQVYTINQFSFTPRTSQASGRVTKADLYVKKSASDNWTLVAENQTFADSADKKTFYFDETEVRYAKFVAKESSDGWVAVSEFDIANRPIATCQAYVEIEGNGSVEGAGDYMEDSMVTLKAVAKGNAAFQGWYSTDGTLLSSDVAYSFQITENTVITAKFEKAAVEFSDVTNPDSFYYTPVYWAVNQGITNGYENGTFEPKQEVTRAELVTFLYRLAGEPEVTGEHPFKDIPKGKYYESAVIWAYQNNIVKGTSATEFSPKEPVTRGQVVTFLHRYYGAETTDVNKTFPDVKANKYYYEAVKWAVKNNITTGNTDGTFTPDTECTRGQAVTFIYKSEAL